MIDLNADLGEGMGDDAALMAVISSCNIACGGHAGDEASMQAALALAKQNGVSVGAHPSYPDREGFGRRRIDISSEDLIRSLTGQVQALQRLAKGSEIEIKHVKPHGALYNEAAIDPGLADLVASLVADLAPEAALVGPPASRLYKAAMRRDLMFVGEAFADRAYQPDGQLVPRRIPGAILEADSERVEQALSIAVKGQVTTLEGAVIALPAQTICLHGDSPGAVKSATKIRAALEAEGIRIRPAQ